MLNAYVQLIFHGRVTSPLCPSLPVGCIFNEILQMI